MRVQLDTTTVDFEYVCGRILDRSVSRSKVLRRARTTQMTSMTNTGDRRTTHATPAAEPVTIADLIVVFICRTVDPTFPI